MKLITSNRTTYPFTTENGITFCGYFIYNGHKYTAQAATTHIADRLNEVSFEQLLNEIDGLFSIIAETEKEVFCAVDHVRSFPFFYAVEDGELILSDNAYSVLDALKFASTDEVSFDEFKLSGVFISGPNTLINEIKGLQSGEYLVYDKNSSALKTAFYYKFSGNSEYPDWTEDEYLSHFSEAFDKACENLKIALAGRTAAVGLSGGYDSRELLVMLKKINYEKVVCFTFGTKGHLDCSYPKKIAEKYGYPWHFIEYTPSTWKKLRKDADFIDYIKTRGNLSVVTEIQDYAAIKYLSENGILPNDSVILTGNTGIIVGGTLDKRLVDGTKVDYDRLIEIVKSHYFNRTDVSDALNERVKSNFDEGLCKTSEQSASQYHNFSIIERGCKFSIGSQRMFEVFGYEALLPICDKNLTDFYKKVPLSLKLDKKLLHNYLIQFDDIGFTRSSATLYSKVGGAIRGTTLLRKIVRKASKITKYFRSTNRIESIFPFFKYAKHALAGSEYFTINYILAHDMMQDAKKRIADKEKADTSKTLSV